MSFDAMPAGPAPPWRALLRTGRRQLRGWRSTIALWRAHFSSADISLFHEFVPPPAGGGHQFLRALWREWERAGLRIESNVVSPATRAILLNSFNFDLDRLRRASRRGRRVVHRVDGPVSLYRGSDDGTDRRVAALNAEFAEATIVQSRFSLEAHRTLGIDYRNPVVIPNAADPDVFHPVGHTPWRPGEPLRVIAASWSDNPRKGAALYAGLETLLSSQDVQMTFVGRTQVPFATIRVVPPQPSQALARLMRAHHVYLTASENDPCSNALIEAMSCGLPAIYRRSGGHPELVGEAGYGFNDVDEVPALLDRLRERYDQVRAKLSPPSIASVAARYLEVLVPGSQ